MKPLHSTILASIGGVLAALGLASSAFAFLLPFGGVLLLYGMSEAAGRLAFPEEQRPIRLIFGFLGALSLLAAAGSAVYYAYKLDTIGLSWLFITLPWLLFAVSPLGAGVRGRAAAAALAIEKSLPEDSLSGIFLILTVCADAAALRWLLGARTAEALRTPWEAVSPVYFLWIALATFCVIGLSYRRRYPHLTLAAASLHLFTLLSPLVLVYAVGYGFDPFVHQAAESLIVSAGEITPKTPYYIGQYALVTTFSHLFRISVESVDRFLLPALAALFLPASAAWLLRRGYGVPRPLALISSLGVFLLPLGMFASTTPQGLANLFFLLTMLLGAAWLHAHRPPLGYVITLAAAATATHPLAGIPALMAVALLMVAKLRHDGVSIARLIKTIVFGLTAAAAAIAIPFVFSVREGNGGASLFAAFKKPIPELLLGIPLEAPGISTRYRPLLDFAEFAARNHDLLLFGLAGIGAWLLLRRKGYRRSAFAAGSLSLALLISVALLRAGFTFKDVIGYEQANYAERLYEAALLSLAPLVLAGVAWWWRALGKADASMRVFHAVLLSALIAALTYAAFPRLDDYRYSRGYSPSIHDMHAAEWISEHGISPYVVLANQSVSAAALQRFGFRTYYGSQFYYSIPTGAPLYQSYLSMVYEGATRETMNSAMRQVNVPTAFFVINDYWTDSARVIAEAKKTADDWQDIDGGKLFIFRYSLK